MWEDFLDFLECNIRHPFQMVGAIVMGFVGWAIMQPALTPWLYTLVWTPVVVGMMAMNWLADCLMRVAATVALLCTLAYALLAIGCIP